MSELYSGSAEKSEFFSSVSRILVSAEFKPGEFEKEYRKHIGIGVSYLADKKNIELMQRELKQKIEDTDLKIKYNYFPEKEKPKLIELIEGRRKAAKEYEQLESEKSHLGYDTGAFLLFDIKRMTPEERHEFITSEFEEKMKEAQGRMEKINVKITQRIERFIINKFPKFSQEEKAKNFTPEMINYAEEFLKKNKKEGMEHNSNFFQRIAEEFGFKGWGREEEVTREDQMNLEIKIELQGFVNQLALRLAAWWGIPLVQIGNKVPLVEITSSGTASFRFKEQNRIIEESKIYFPIGFIKKGQLSALENWQSILAEEVGHFIENFVCQRSPGGHEFFGMICRLIVAETVHGAFKTEYREYLSNASKYRERAMKLSNAETILTEKIEELPVSRFQEKPKLFEQRQSITNQLDHLPQYYAALIFPTLKRMTPSQRYEILSNPERVESLISEGARKLDELRNKLEERSNRTQLSASMYKQYLELSMLSDEERLRKGYTPEQFAELKQRVDISLGGLKNTEEFFQRQAKEAGYQGWGRGMEYIFYRGISGINLEEALLILTNGMKSSGLISFGNEFREKYMQRIGLDIADKTKENIIKLLDAHRDATPLIEGKRGACFISLTPNRKVVEDIFHSRFIFTISIPREKIAESEDQINENTLLVRDRDFNKFGEYEYKTTRSLLSPVYILSVEDRETGKIYKAGDKYQTSGIEEETKDEQFKKQEEREVEELSQEYKQIAEKEETDLENTEKEISDRYKKLEEEEEREVED
jgi:hypothetical protein